MHNRDQAQIIQQNASHILLTKGPEEALIYLRDHANLENPQIRQRIHAIVWNHQELLSKELLSQPFLDHAYCHCSVCEHNWLIFPLLCSSHLEPEEAENLSQRNRARACPACGRVLCNTCAQYANDTCTCGSKLVGVKRSNGRQLKVPVSELAEADEKRHSWLPAPPDTPVESKPDLYLFFSMDGKVPIGIDASLPRMQTGSVEQHIAWVETLLDAGIYYHAQEQLDLIGSATAQNGRVLWLRARLQHSKYKNASRYHRSHHYVSGDWYRWPETIIANLEQAIEFCPDDGRIVHNLAQAYLDLDSKEHVSKALACARKAASILPEDLDVCLTLGKALRLVGQYGEALSILKKIPQDYSEYEVVRQEQFLADLELKCEQEPIDVAAHLRLGYWYWRHLELRDRGKMLFDKLVQNCPDCAESYYALAREMWHEYKRPDRLNETHRLCKAALDRNPNLALAYELLGGVYQEAARMREAISFPIEDHTSYYKRAVDIDPTSCDIALWQLGNDAIDRNDLKTTIDMLEQAVRVGTDIGSVYQILAVVYMGTRQYEKQDWANKKAKELEPDTQLTSEFQNRILAMCNFEY
ncbi:MAG TPA: tetratricopeptide repeat protein [Anaerolineales bacterium]|nr:tetratricopeptide repeat protein [Anaerolineales bacterium]